MSGMSQTRRRAWWILGVWGVAAVGFAIAFFGFGGGPSEFGTERWPVLATAVAIGFGYAGLVVVMLATRGRGGAVVTDERDAQVNSRASQVTMVALGLGAYAVPLGLWEGYREVGTVPIGWLWLIAYGTLIALFVVHSVATLVVDARYGGHG